MCRFNDLRRDGFLTVWEDSDRQAEAKAILKRRKNDLAASTKLEKRGLQSESRVIAFQADLQTAKAQLARIQHELHETKIAAPFDGILNKRMVELGDYMQSGDVFLLQFQLFRVPTYGFQLIFRP